MASRVERVKIAGKKEVSKVQRSRYKCFISISRATVIFKSMDLG